MYEKWDSEKAKSTSTSSGGGSASKTKRIVLNDFAGGLNLTPAVYTLKHNESRESKNLSPNYLPAICPKSDYHLIANMGNANNKSIGILHNGHLFITRQYTSTTTEIIDVDTNTSIGLLSHDGIGAYNVFYSYDELDKCTAFYTNTGHMRVLNPNGITIGTAQLGFPVNFSCVHQGRIVVGAVEINDVHVAKQYYADYMNRNFDSFTVGSFAEGCRGLMSYKNSILYWSPTALYKIATNYPINDTGGANDDYRHTITVVSNSSGACLGNTVADVLGTIIWYGNNRVFAYKGSNVEVISQNIQSFLDDIDESEFTHPPVAGTIGEYYYLVFNLPNKSIMLTYDTKNKSWLIADGENIISFTKKNQDLIAFCINGSIKNMSKNLSITKPWSYKSPYFARNELGDSFSIKANLAEDAVVTVYVTADGRPDPILIGTITYQNNEIEKSFDYPSQIDDDAKISIELEGNGKTIIHAITL